MKKENVKKGFTKFQEERIMVLKKEWQKPELEELASNGYTKTDCSDMASCAGLTMCYCLNVNNVC